LSPTLTEQADGTRRRREERKAQNRAQLLAAARKVFAEKGLEGATARDIVRETDLATGTFYNYFSDKDEIFSALLEEVSAKARPRVRAERLREGATLEERMEAAYRAYFELAVEERELFLVLQRNAGAIAMMSGEEIFDAGVRELFEDIAAWVQAGELQGLRPESPEVQYLATAMAGMGFHIANRLVAEAHADVGGAARFCTRLILSGMREPDGAAGRFSR